MNLGQNVGMRRVLAGLLLVSTVLPAAPSFAAPRDQVSLPSRPFTRVGTLVIARLKLTTPIFLGLTDAIFDAGVGQWPGTAKPGRAGNLVIGGHRTGGMMPFLNIGKIRKGDKIKVIVGKQTYVYTVTRSRIIKPTDVSITKQTRGATLTLFTCHPPHSIKTRFVVQASLGT